MPRSDVYETSPVKRRRRTKAQLQTIDDTIVAILTADHPKTVRGVFYAVETKGLVEKTEKEYKNVDRYLTKLRRSGRVPYHWISDSTRWMRKPKTDPGLASALRRTAQTYRRALWDEQPDYVEIWCEKDALAGILIDVTALYDVPLMVIKGFSSLTYLYSAAVHIRSLNKPTFIGLLIDRDPSGVTTARTVERELRGFLPPNFPLTIELLAVTEQQIVDWLLPTRPTKRKGNTHAKDFVGDSVELDAIESWRLRHITEAFIERHIDPDILARTKAIERLERESLMALSEDGWLEDEEADIAEAVALRWGQMP